MLKNYNKCFVFLLSSIVLFLKVTSVFGANLQPHIAIYDLTLLRSDEKSGIAGVDGLLVYEFTGSACEGYIVNYRLMMRVIDNDAHAQVTDVRVNSFEEGDGSKFTFLSRSFSNNQLNEEIRGSAERSKKGAQIQLTKPEKTQVFFSGQVIFPTEQTIHIIDAAKHGKTTYSSHLYDGANDGSKSYLSSAIIGAPIRAGQGLGEEHALKNMQTAKLRRWPVEIAYFDYTETGDVTPDYVVSFDLFEDGVSWQPVFDYGDFVLKGKMRSFKPLKMNSCR